MATLLTDAFLSTLLFGAVTAGVPLYLSGVTAGRVTSLASAGRQILNCTAVNAASVASAVSTITALIQRPFAQGQIT